MVSTSMHCPVSHHPTDALERSKPFDYNGREQYEQELNRIDIGRNPPVRLHKTDKLCWITAA